jgi:hypothetical protein
MQENWSGAFLSSRSGISGGVPVGSADVQPYQYPGGVYFEPGDGRVSICYGPGRLMDGFGPLRSSLLGEIIEPVSALASVCTRAQFDGPLQVKGCLVDTIGEVEQETSIGTRVLFTLADTAAEAVLFDDALPHLAASFARSLPASGTVTNTHSSGPLMRFWNETGGVQGVTTLEYSQDEGAAAQSILYPGHIYYLTKPTHAGLRITLTAPAIMRSPSGGPGLTLIRLGRLVGDWAAFADTAEQLQVTGEKTMTIRLDSR